MSQRIALYVYGFFDSPNQSEWGQAQTWIDDIIASDFNIVVLASFHVDANGNLFGTVPVVVDGALTDQVNPALPQLYQSLAKAGKTLLYSIGNWAGTANDLTTLETILNDPTGAPYAMLQQNLGFVNSQFAMSGIDFDFEPHDANAYSAQQQQTVVQFTNFVDNLGMIVTYCPYEEEQWWIDAQNAATGSVAWWNLQCYGGALTSIWLPSLQGVKGVTDPNSFLVSGFSIDSGATPDDTQTQFSAWAGGVKGGLSGGFIWQQGDIENGTSGYTVSEYATAVINGLNNPSATASPRRGSGPGPRPQPAP